MNFLASPLIALVALASSTGGAAACTTADIDVDSLSVSSTSISIRVVGRLVNRCATPTGVEVKLVLYGTSGLLLGARDVWPASVRNIPARSEYPFEMLIPQVDGFERIEVRLSRVKQW